MPEWIQNICDFFAAVGDFFVGVGDFFVAMWNDEERWLCIGGFFVFLIMFCKIFLAPILTLFGVGNGGSSSPRKKSNHKSSKKSTKMKVTIKGVYQMNGPKPFTREILISPSESSYYSQLAASKTKQAQWISANFPGADTARGFSMAINIK
ncbi:MAG: hypothetical protein K2K47_08000 [Duncaniella sp.]|nr:hypothetical protein [Duncaniella sp.]